MLWEWKRPHQILNSTDHQRTNEPLLMALYVPFNCSLLQPLAGHANGHLKPEKRFDCRLDAWTSASSDILHSRLGCSFRSAFEHQAKPVKLFHFHFDTDWPLVPQTGDTRTNKQTERKRGRNSSGSTLFQLVANLVCQWNNTNSSRSSSNPYFGFKFLSWGGRRCALLFKSLVFVLVVLGSTQSNSQAASRVVACLSMLAKLTKQACRD